MGRDVFLDSENQIVIFGCGGHSRSVVDILLSYKPSVSLLFIDEQAKPNEFLYGFSVQPKLDNFSCPYFFGIGNNEKRERMYSQIGPSGLISIISPKAHIGKQSVLQKGVFVGNFCHVGPETQIGANTILNNGCIVEHEVIIGKHSHVGPQAVISGRSKIGDRVFLGVGSIVKDSISICSDVITGAGCVVVKDITEPGVYVGCPAKRIKPYPFVAVSTHAEQVLH